jgi:hypothetical protein
MEMKLVQKLLHAEVGFEVGEEVVGGEEASFEVVNEVGADRSWCWR